MSAVETILQGRSIHPGSAEGEALVSRMGISFFGGVDPETGTVVDKGHDLEGRSISGRVLVFPTGKGSTVGSYTLYRMKKAGTAPAAILNAECEPITAVGCILAGIPCIDRLPLDRIYSGDILRIDATAGTVERGNPGADTAVRNLLPRLPRPHRPRASNSRMAANPANSPLSQPSLLKKIWRLYGRTFALILSMIAGSLVPEAESAASLLPYLLMGMLFFAFLDITITRESFRASMLLIFLANLAIPLAVFFLFRPFDPVVALIAFLTAIAPTATATPVIVSYLRGRVDYVLPCVLLTNIGIALILPFLLPWVAGATVHITTGEILPPVLEVMFVPLILAFLLRKFLPPIQRFLLPGKVLSFPIWLAMLFIVTSRASAFLQSSAEFSAGQLLWIGFISLIICVVNFGLGAMIGGREFRHEGSQALGQKNNSFTVWIALTYLTPLAALGPTFYVLYHNLYNGLQLYMAERDATRKPEKPDAFGAS